VVPATSTSLDGVSAIGMIMDTRRADSTTLVLTMADLVTKRTVEDDIVKRVLGTSGQLVEQAIQRLRR
jgi:hypothetical protein